MSKIFYLFVGLAIAQLASTAPSLQNRRLLTSGSKTESHSDEACFKIDGESGCLTVQLVSYDAKKTEGVPQEAISTFAVYENNSLMIIPGSNMVGASGSHQDHMNKGFSWGRRLNAYIDQIKEMKSVYEKQMEH